MEWRANTAAVATHSYLDCFSSLQSLHFSLTDSYGATVDGVQ